MPLLIQVPLLERPADSTTVIENVDFVDFASQKAIENLKIYRDSPAVEMPSEPASRRAPMPKLVFSFHHLNHGLASKRTAHEGDYMPQYSSSRKAPL